MKQYLIRTKTILLLISITMLLGSCEIFDPIFNPQKDVCILQKMAMTVPGDPAHEDTEFIYDSSGKLIEAIKKGYDLEPYPDVQKWEMTYSNDQLHKAIKYSKFQKNPEEKVGEWFFHYTGNLPDTINGSVSASAKNANYTIVDYNGDKLSKIIDYIYNAQDTSFIVFQTKDFDWIGDNISKITITNRYGSSTTREFEYDNMKAPLSHLGLVLSSYGSPTMMGKNNVIKSTYTIGTKVYINETVYTYNDLDYPISSAPMDSSWLTTYEYDCK